MAASGHQHRINFIIRRIVDISMTAALMLLMASQVTGRAAHEWTGIVLFLLVIVHHVLNRRWYAGLLRGRYTAKRTISVIVNTALMVSFLMTAVSGMLMSTHAVPFLHRSDAVGTARAIHLVMSHWSFVLMGIHLGMHWHIMTGRMKTPGTVRIILRIAAAAFAIYGWARFFIDGIPGYLFGITQYAFLDYSASAVVVFLRNLAMLSAMVWTTDKIWALAHSRAKKSKRKF